VKADHTTETRQENSCDMGS